VLLVALLLTARAERRVCFLVAMLAWR